VRRGERGSIGAATAVVLAGLLLGGIAGYATAQVSETGPTQLASARPIPASSPSLPTTSPTPYSDDVDFPTLEPDLAYHRVRSFAAPYTWTYVHPVGWERDQIGLGEFTWQVPDNPSGSYGMRIKLVVSQRRTPEQMVNLKLADLRSGYVDVHVLTKTADTLAITYRAVPEGWLRYNTFRWFPDGAGTATVELSVNGRSEDVAGLNDLLGKVSASMRPLA